MSASRPITQHYHQGTHAGWDTTSLPLRIRDGNIYCSVDGVLIATGSTTNMQLLDAVGTHLRARAEQNPTNGGPGSIGRRVGHPKVIELKSRQ